MADTKSHTWTDGIHAYLLHTKILQQAVSKEALQQVSKR